MPSSRSEAESYPRCTPARAFPTVDRDEPEAGNDDTGAAVAAAQEAFEAVADGDCDAFAELTTADFQDRYENSPCTSAPDDLEITGAELDDDNPVTVTVQYVAGESDDEIPVEMELVDGSWLIADLGFGSGSSDD